MVSAMGRRRGCIATLLLAGALAAGASPSTAASIEDPVVAVTSGHGVVAWTEGGFVRVADERPDGSFGPGLAVGRVLGTSPPKLAANSLGTVVVVWAYGERVHWARRDEPGTWRWGTMPQTDAGPFAQLSVVVDEAGRATFAFADRVVPVSDDGVSAVGGSELWIGTQTPRGGWGGWMMADDGAVSPSLSLDSDGDAVIAYRARGGICAVTQTAGSGVWSPPLLISGTDDVESMRPLVAGGGSRTFVVSWSALPLGRPPGTMRAARLRLPGVFAAPVAVVPPGYVDPGGQAVAYALAPMSAVDPSGNALYAWQFPASGYGSGVAVAALPYGGDDWTTPTVLDAPSNGDAGDSRPSIAFADDGVATVAFVRRGTTDLTLRVAVAPSVLGGWQGAAAAAVIYGSCRAGTTCVPLPFGPVLAQHGGTSVIAVPARTGLQVVVRSGPGARWIDGYTHVLPASATTVSLRGARIHQGVARVAATCALPPCTGTVVMWTRGARPRIVGHLRVSMPDVRAVSIGITLTRVARMLLARQPQLRVQLDMGLREADGTTQRVRSPAALRA
jgi:hypothetical protein